MWVQIAPGWHKGLQAQGAELADEDDGVQGSKRQTCSPNLYS